jgi:voltage-gated potassium channel
MRERRKPSRSEESLRRFEEQIELPMLVLSLAIIPLLVIPLVADLSRPVEDTFIALDWAVWAAFLIEYLVRVYLAPRKLRFVRQNLFDLLIVVLPFLRPLRVVRSARELRILRATRAVSFLGRAGQSAREIVTRHKLHYVLMVGIAIVFLGAVLTREFERGAPGSTINSFSDALWWAISTAGTLGAADKAPVTAAGRGVAVVLMMFGLGVFGLLAASFASFFVGEREEEELDPKLNEALERLARIEAVLERLEPKPAEAPSPEAHPDVSAQGGDHVAEARPLRSRLARRRRGGGLSAGG